MLVASALLAGPADAADTEGPCPPDRAAWLAGAAADSERADAPSRVQLGGRKIAGRPLSRSEAGVSWSLSPKIALEFNYARNAFPPMMPNDHDDGVIGRLKLGF